MAEELSTESALSIVKQVLNGYKGFKKLEATLSAAVTAKAEAAGAEKRKKVIAEEVEALDTELLVFRKTVQEEKGQIRKKLTEDLDKLKASRQKSIDELEAKLSAKIMPLQAEEVRAEKAVENLQKEINVLHQERKQEQDKLDAVKVEFNRIKAIFS